MVRHVYDSGNINIARLNKIHAQLVYDDGEITLHTKRRVGWFAWIGILVGVVVLASALASFVPMRAGASAKTQAPFSLPAPVPAPQTEMQAGVMTAIIARPESKQSNGPMIALVIDDIGPARYWSEMAIGLPAPVTLAVLPYVSDAAEWAVRAKATGHDVLLHMPMEPLGLEDPGPGALLRALPAVQNRKRLKIALARVPGVIGINNHMGSRFTSCKKCIEQVADMLYEQDLLFLDSVTSPASAAAGIVERSGVPVIRRDVFLDDINTPAAIAVQIQRAEQLAHENGVVVVIAHPRPDSIAALQDWLKSLDGKGIELVSLHEAMLRKQTLERGLLSRVVGL